jgi:hypothetical protein
MKKKRTKIPLPKLYPQIFKLNYSRVVPWHEGDGVGMEPRSLCMLGKHSATEPYPQPRLRTF